MRTLLLEATSHPLDRSSVVLSEDMSANLSVNMTGVSVDVK